jgi:NADPH:quinone reductase-like Zn-dependent oxidoreductase
VQPWTMAAVLLTGHGGLDRLEYRTDGRASVDVVFESLVEYVERGEVRPVVSRTYPLADITHAQRDFLEKEHIGELVLIPPAPER